MGESSSAELRQRMHRLLPSPNPTSSVWQTSHHTPVAHFNSTPNLPAKSTIIIVGSGISAAFAAEELLSLEPDVDVLVIEARGTCSAATGRNGGHLLPQTFGEEREILDFEISNFNTVVNFIEHQKIPCEFRRLRSCHGFWNKSYFDEAKNALKRTVHDPQRTWAVDQKPELHRLRLKGAIGAIVQDIAASLSPYKLVTWMWEGMLKRHPKLNLQTDTPVLSLEPQRSTLSDTKWIVETERGCVAARFVILATNGYAAHLLPQFNDLITPVQCWMSALKPSPSSPFATTLIEHSYGMRGVGPQDRVQDDFLIQRPVEEAAQFMFGGARAQVPGNGIGDSDDSHVPARAKSYLDSVLGQLLDLRSPLRHGRSPHEKLESDGEWGGIMGFSRDQRPWVGEVPDMRGVYLSAGFTGHGKLFSPAKDSSGLSGPDAYMGQECRMRRFVPATSLA